MPPLRSTMDFFQNQAAAKPKTVRLVFLFILAVFFIISGVYGAVLYGWMYFSKEWQGWWQPGLFYEVAAGVVVVVLLGTLYKMIELAKGGAKVAEMLGGVPIAPHTNDPEQRRLLNVVEEMALASGVPVPQVFILADETSINAFAAGLKPDDAVVAVTQAITIFYRQVELRDGLPFDVAIPTRTTQRTFAATDAGRDLVVCKDADDLFRKLGI